jgi:hypothetical protein
MGPLSDDLDLQAHTVSGGVFAQAWRTRKRRASLEGVKKRLAERVDGHPGWASWWDRADASTTGTSSR